MGCASSGPLPFLSNRGNEALAEPARMNGELPYEVKMASGDGGVAIEGHQMKEAVDSTVQNVMGAVVQKKDEIVDQVEGLNDRVQETMEATLEKLTDAVDAFEDKLSAEATSMGETIEAALAPAEEEDTAGEMRPEEIDELLESLPTEAEVTAAAAAAAAAAAEDVPDKATGGDEE